MNIGASLYQLNTNARAFSPKDSARVNQGSGDQFIDALLSKTSAGRDTFIQSGQDRSYFMYDAKIGNALFQTKGQPHAGEIQDVETERYIITARQRGELCIYDKMRDENFIWDLSKNNVQVDAKTGSKFLINNLGSGFFIMAAVDSELENGLKQALGVDALEEKDLIGFTVHQDRKTGIQYITANGYESQGGQIIMDDNAHKQLDSMAKEYLKEYPNLVRNYNEAWFYATFEVRGLAKRSPNGIMMIGPNSLTFMHKDGIHRWLAVFDEEDWEKVKEAFDKNAGNAGAETWEFWEQLFHGMKLNVHRVVPDNLSKGSIAHNLRHLEDDMGQISESENKYCSLCGSRIKADGTCPICIVPTFISGNKQSHNQNVSQANSNKLVMLPRNNRVGRKA